MPPFIYLSIYHFIYLSINSSIFLYLSIHKLSFYSSFVCCSWFSEASRARLRRQGIDGILREDCGLYKGKSVVTSPGRPVSLRGRAGVKEELRATIVGESIYLVENSLPGMAEGKRIKKGKKEYMKRSPLISSLLGTPRQSPVSAPARPPAPTSCLSFPPSLVQYITLIVTGRCRDTKISCCRHPSLLRSGRRREGGGGERRG